MKKKLNDLKNNFLIKKISVFIKQSYLFFDENKMLFIYIFGSLLNGIVIHLKKIEQKKIGKIVVNLILLVKLVGKVQKIGY